LICAGGTGGGVYPALAVVQALKSEVDPVAKGERQSRLRRLTSALHLLWVGGAGGMEANLVDKANIPFQAIPAAGVHGVGWKALPGNLWQLARGFLAARRLLRRFQPQVLFFTGGYVAVPVALAASLPGRGYPRPPILLYVPDIEPGLALKVLSLFADRIAVTVEDSRAYYPRHKNVQVSGYPTRSDLRRWDKAGARRLLGLEATLPVLLVFGGSKGARSINRALLAILPNLLAEMQVIHISGQLDWEEVQAARQHLAKTLPVSLLERYRAYPYLHDEMGAALAVADLVVCRAGASVLGELPLFGLPAVLVPYPYAWRYQTVNARYLEQRRAAVIVEDAHLSERLLPAVLDLIRDEKRRNEMGAAMAALARPDAAKQIAVQLLELAPDNGGAA